jgi:hypothetical protein
MALTTGSRVRASTTTPKTGLDGGLCPIATGFSRRSPDVCRNPDDTGIGQQLERIADRVDCISPMLYPSSFQFGIPGYRNPAQHPYEIVHRSLERALERTGVPPLRFRPWLQAFPDYAFGAGAFTAGQVRAQIRAA